MAVKMASSMAETWPDKIVDLMAGCWTDGIAGSRAVWITVRIVGSIIENWIVQMVG